MTYQVEDFSNFRNRLLNDALLGVAIVSTPSVILSISRAVAIGWKPVMGLHLALLIVLWLLWLFHSKLSYSVRVWGILGTLATVSYGGIIQFGPASGAQSFAVMLAFVSMLFLNPRMAWLVVGINAIGLILIGVAASQNTIRFDLDYSVYAYHPITWVNMIWGAASYGAVLAYIVWCMVNGLLKRQALAEKLVQDLLTSQSQLHGALDGEENKVKERTAELELALILLRESQDKLAHSEAKATLSTLIAGVSHELKTPLGVGLIAASALLDKTREFANSVELGTLKRSDMAAFVSSSINGAELLQLNLKRAAELLSQFQQVASDQASEQRREFELAEVVHEIVATLAPSLKRHPHKVIVDIPPNLLMDSQPGPLGQVIINLINNAYLHAFENRTDGVLTIHAEADGDRVKMSFTDNGVGMSKEILEKMFKPFFSTKIGKGGTGLGMAIVENLVKKTLGGSLQVYSKAGEGTRFDIQLPRVLPKQKQE